MLLYSSVINPALVFAGQAMGLGPDAPRVLGDEGTALLAKHRPTQIDDPELLRQAIRSARRKSCT